ncbi:MAG: N-acetylmuramoyl-L-alanine amidase [Burkholderiales bacterium]|nr:N-acetylmuramoyl-L-alanine amidase [Burkholderiales bacterium]
MAGRAWKWAGLLAAALSACAPLPRYTTLPVESRPSPNAGERRPNYVILHHTTNDTAEEALATLTSPLARVSAHYLVARDGRIVYLVDELKRAWHAGDSYWGGNRDLNSSSIGIELDNNGREPFPDAQIGALIALLGDLAARWNIPPANVLAHGDIAPGRKVDPGPLFPWRRLAAAGFGLWCDPPYPQPAPATDDALLLAALGYDVTRLPAAVAAFKRHWASDDPEPGLRDEQRGLLLCLIGRQQEGGQAMTGK